MSDPRPLQIFIVEDESLILMLLRDMLEDLGHECVCEASGIDTALRLAQSALYDLALLDVNVRGETTYGVADKVIARGLPVIFATGYGVQGIAAGYKHLPILQKPFNLRALGNAVEAAGRQTKNDGS